MSGHISVNLQQIPCPSNALNIFYNSTYWKKNGNAGWNTLYKEKLFFSKTINSELAVVQHMILFKMLTSEFPEVSLQGNVWFTALGFSGEAKDLETVGTTQGYHLYRAVNLLVWRPIWLLLLLSREMWHHLCSQDILLQEVKRLNQLSCKVRAQPNKTGHRLQNSAGELGAGPELSTHRTTRGATTQNRRCHKDAAKTTWGFHKYTIIP